MHAKTFCSGLGLVIALALQGCGSNDNKTVLQQNAEISEADATQMALTVVPGSAGAVEKIDTADEHRWGVSVGTAGGGTAVVELERAGGHLAEITSAQGPFEYDLPPAAPGFVVYAKARSAALDAKQGQLEGWEIKLDANVWEFYVRDSNAKLWEVKLSAQTGALVSVMEKATRD
jgi:uncharacterized membrane protein YkoI